MYTSFFKLKQAPFSIAPDPRYLFMSERHREALAHLLYGVDSGGGFVLLTGEIGAGKTTVCRCFMEQLPADCKLAYIFNPKLSVEELLLSICEEFRIDPALQGNRRASVKTYVDVINAYLLRSHAQGVNNVLIIDEAQNLAPGVLEQLRLLTNLETNERKLLQIILIGQPELRTMLARPELEQLAQRVIARYHLASLSAGETASYIGHRLAVAGASAPAAFPRRLLAQIHQLSRGVPRRINLLCDRALLGAYVENRREVTRNIVRKAAAEVFAGQGKPASAVAPRWPYALAGVMAGVLLAGGAAWQARDAPMPQLRQAPPAPANPVPAPANPVPAPANPVPAPANPVPAPANPVPAPSNPVTAPSNPVMAPPVPAPALPFDAAVRELAALWGQDLAGGEPCQAAANSNLRCHRSKGGLKELRLLDRPAVLSLRDSSYALLTGLSAAGATLRVNGKDQASSLAKLSARFDGEFLTLWRTPRGWRDSVSAGDHGPDVDWLNRCLAQLQGTMAPPDKQVLDTAMVRQFQASQKLEVDGVAGPKTFMRLMQLGGATEPRLQHAAGAAAGK